MYAYNIWYDNNNNLFISHRLTGSYMITKYMKHITYLSICKVANTNTIIGLDEKAELCSFTNK